MAEPVPTRQRGLSPAQERTRQRVETMIGFAAPVLDLVLAVGERISRLAEPEDYEYYPVRPREREKERRTGGADAPIEGD